MTNPPQAVRARLVQLDVRPGRPAENTDRMLAHVAESRDAGVQLIVFPELAVPGYLLGDEWERPAFLRECVACGERLAAAADGIVIVFGNVGVDFQRRNEDGRFRRYNGLFIADGRRFVGPEGSPLPYIVKTLHPNYRCFDDTRHFHDTRRLAAESGIALEALLQPVRTSVGRLGGLVCEDAWDQDYALSPPRLLAAAGAQILVNASCSPFTRDKNHKRNRVFGQLAKQLRRPMIYVNSVGVQDIGKTVYAFDGGSCVYDAMGGIVEGIAPFEEGALTLEIPLEPRGFGAPVELQRDDASTLTEAILRGTGGLMQRLGIRRAVIGVSGGIDSAVVAALYGRLLPADDILLVNMPGPFSSRTTRRLAAGLAANLGACYAEIPIGDSVDLTAGQFARLAIAGPNGRAAGDLKLSPFALENVQARDRGSRVLAAAAAAFGGVLTCNANKAELTVGYGTLYGDIIGWLASIGDCWKGQVYAIGRSLNERYGREIIPEGIFSIVPSAELSAAQAVDEGKGDPLIYPYHDNLFRAWVERWQRATPEDILEWYLAGTLEQEIEYEGRVKALFSSPAAFVADVERWWSLYQGLGVAKRIQAPPVMAISRRAFGFDHREAQLGARYTRRYQELKARMLASEP